MVSGGGTGIGRAVAERFVADGDEVVVLGRRESVLAEVVASLGERASYLVADLADVDQVRAAADRIAAGGPVDVVVPNAGGNFDEGLADEHGLAGTRDDWQANFTGNVLTCVLLVEALLPHVRRPGGRIVTMGSVAGIRGANSYGAAKAAVHNWSLWLAAQVAADGITVNAVAPGLVPDTEFWASTSPEVIAQRAATIPVGRPGTPAEVAELVAYFASPAAGWTTGQILQINGGVVPGRG